MMSPMQQLIKDAITAYGAEYDVRHGERKLDGHSVEWREILDNVRTTNMAMRKAAKSESLYYGRSQRLAHEAWDWLHDNVTADEDYGNEFAANSYTVYARYEGCFMDDGNSFDVSITGDSDVVKALLKQFKAWRRAKRIDVKPGVKNTVPRFADNG